MDLKELISLGKELYLEGAELRTWVDKEMEAAKERLIIQREIIREEKEKAKEQQLLLDKQVQMAERQRELELERLQDPPLLTNENVGYGEAAGGNTLNMSGPKMPTFDERKDQLDAYLTRFERFANMHRWTKDEWALRLSMSLTGKALEVVGRLTDDEAKDYETLKEALLKRFNLTEEGFKEKFRKSKPEIGEQFGQFRMRIASYLEKWILLSGKDKNVAEDVVDLMLREQLMNTLTKQMTAFILERPPKDTNEMIDFVERYAQVHGPAAAFSRGNSQPMHVHHPRPTEGTEPKVGIQGHSNKSAKPNRTTMNVRCYNCSKLGHVAKDCRAKLQVNVARQAKTCDNCHKRGHTMSECRRQENSERSAAVVELKETDCHHHSNELTCGCKTPIVSAVCFHQTEEPGTMPVANGKLNGKDVRVLRDSGCTCVVIRKGLVERDSGINKTRWISLADGTVVSAQTTVAHLECPYFSGSVEAVELDSPLYDVILGNIVGAKCPGTYTESTLPVEPIKADKKSEHRDDPIDIEAAAVGTRASKTHKMKALLTPPCSGTNPTSKELAKMQKEDKSLEFVHKLATNKEVKQTGRSHKVWYEYKKGILHRCYVSTTHDEGNILSQVVVPATLRNTVMKTAHESILAGHMAAKKTTERILQDFYWPGIWGDVSRFCRSCDTCQRSAPKGHTRRVPMVEVPLIDEPFSRVAVDLIGPIRPSDRKGRYILTVVDYCTRYPEAVVLQNTETTTVAEALLDIFSRTGVPKEILTDRGSQFTSEIMKELCRLLSIKKLSTTAYHPQSNGLVERFNATLKGMLKKLADERPTDWDRYVNAALFAYREAPQESLGFSPFELLYGRPIRGPMTILRELWTEDITDEEVKTTYQYVVDLREKMESMIDLAHQNLKSSSAKYKQYFDRKARPRSFQPGDKVLLLLPTQHNKLELKWQGPFSIIKKTNIHNYLVDIGTCQRVYHANMLKKYYEREDQQQQVGALFCAVAAVIDEAEEHPEHSCSEPRLEMPCLEQTQTYKDVPVGSQLHELQKQQLEQLLMEYQDVFTDVPGKTNAYTFDIKLTSDIPVRKKPYPVPQALKDTMKEEVKSMLEAGIIEPSESPYCSPSVIVRKKDGTNRYCVDYRNLNNITIFDAEPMPQLNDLLQHIGSESQYMTRIDLTKGYWQIPLSDNAKPLTAFATEMGLMQFRVMPFGLQCASSAFSRLMRKVLGDMDNVKNYIDDIVIHHRTWEEHIKCLREVFERLRKAGLTAKPSKCLMAFPEVEFLGHIIGNGRMTPAVDKVEAIKSAKPPETKKQLRSFLGLASFYRQYVPNFSAIASPLTDATRKGMPNKPSWSEPQQRAFVKIKELLTSEPVLRLPDYDKQFILSTDASDKGVGAVLFQEFEDGKFPIVYLSRKLLPNEQKYSVVEKECLALVWAVKKLSSYLIGREFLVETDHAPLIYLNKAKNENGRLMRWSLVLHQYRFNIRAISGKSNHGPDYLSRRS